MPFSLEQFRKSYETELFPVKVSGHELQFHKPINIERFIDPEDLMSGFPLWAKIWEASAVLLHYMADLQVDPEKRILELGSGLGVTGIASMVLGHNITLTEYDPHALNFLKANAQINQCEPALIQHLDWFQPELKGSFELIIGSEIIYQEKTVNALGALFEKYLAPEGKVLIAERVRATNALFFEKMSSQFNIRAKKHTLRFQEKSEVIILFELTRLQKPKSS